MRRPESTRRRGVVLPFLGFVIGGLGGGIATATSGMAAGWAIAGGAVAGVAGLAAGVALEAGQARKSDAESRQQALAARAAAGDVLPIPRENPSDSPRPSWWLSPDTQLAPFRTRMRELRSLREWLANDSAPRVLVMVGPAWVGKSRVVVEFARGHAEGWTVLRVRPGREKGLLEILSGLDEPTLVVVDLKVDRPGFIPLLQDLRATSAKVRLLIECRSEAWHDSVKKKLGESDAGIIDDAARIEVASAGSEDDLLRWLNEAARATADVVGVQPPTPVTRSPERGSTLLEVQIQAMAVVLGSSTVTSQQNPTVAQIGSYLLEVEEASWQTPKRSHHLGDRTLQSRAVAILTLLGASDESRAAQVLLRLPDLAAESDEGRRREVARWVHSLYPTDEQGQWIGRPEPDLLAHALYAATFNEDPRLVERLTHPNPSSAEFTRALQSLVAGIASFQPLEVVAHSLLAASPLRSLPAAIGVALYLPDTKAADRLLAAHLCATALTLQDLDKIEPLLRADLRQTRSVAAQLGVEAARRGNSRPVLGIALRKLAIALHNLGRYPESLTSAEESVDLYRQLAADDPAVHRPHLALALQNLGPALGAVGRDRESLSATEEAVNLYRQLAADNPAARPDLAHALQNLGPSLSRVGRHSESVSADEEAVGLYRQLAAGNPAVHLPHLALALQNLGAALGEVGHHSESLPAREEAVGLYRQLAAGNPAVHLPHLALAINNLGYDLSQRLGRQSEAVAIAQEAVDLYRHLVADNPAAHHPQLALALRNLGFALGSAGHFHEMLTVAEESLCLYRQLAADNPTAHRPAVAFGLRNLGVALGRVGRARESLAADEEAVALYRQLVADTPAVYRSDLAVALLNLAAGLRRVAHPGSFSAAEEAVNLYRQLVTENRAVERPRLAVALRTLGHVHEDLGNRDEAKRCYSEAGPILLESAGAQRAVYAGMYLDNQRELRDLLRAMGRTTDEITMGLRDDLQTQ